MGYKVKPKNERDGELSKQHLRESVDFNMSHAKDHLKEVKQAKKLLKDRIKDHKKGY